MEIVSRCAEEVFIPLTVGGGVSSVADVDALLRAGADKVSINTSAINRPEPISEIAERFGSQVLVLSVDARRAAGTPSGFEVTTHGGRNRLAWTPSSGPAPLPSEERGRSCSTQWTPMAPRTGSTSS